VEKINALKKLNLKKSWEKKREKWVAMRGIEGESRN